MTGMPSLLWKTFASMAYTWHAALLFSYIKLCSQPCHFELWPLKHAGRVERYSFVGRINTTPKRKTYFFMKDTKDTLIWLLVIPVNSIYLVTISSTPPPIKKFYLFECVKPTSIGLMFSTFNGFMRKRPFGHCKQICLRPQQCIYLNESDSVSPMTKLKLSLKFS